MDNGGREGDYQAQWRIDLEEWIMEGGGKLPGSVENTGLEQWTMKGEREIPDTVENRLEQRRGREGGTVLVTMEDVIHLGTCFSYYTYIQEQESFIGLTC